MIATLGFLSIHQDEQEKAYIDVKNRIDFNGELVVFTLVVHSAMS